jgi:hypothetical protein
MRRQRQRSAGGRGNAYRQAANKSHRERGDSAEDDAVHALSSRGAVASVTIQ